MFYRFCQTGSGFINGYVFASPQVPRLGRRGEVHPEVRHASTPHCSALGAHHPQMGAGGVESALNSSVFNPSVLCAELCLKCPFGFNLINLVFY